MFNLNNIKSYGADENVLYKKGAKDFVQEYQERFKDIKADYDKRYLALAEEIEKFNNQFAFMQSREKGRALVKELKGLLDFAENFNDPTQIERQNQTWLNNTLQSLEAEGGAYSAELKNQAIEGYLLASSYGVRIAQTKVRQNAYLSLDKYDNDFRQALTEGDIGKALSVQHEREAALNSYQVEGIFTNKETSAYLNNSKQAYADNILLKSLEENQLTEVSESRDKALDDLKAYQKMFKPFFGRASDKIQTSFLARIKNLENSLKANNLPIRQDEYTNTLFTWLQGGTTTTTLNKFTDRYEAAINDAISNDLLKPAEKAKAIRELERTKVTQEVINELTEVGQGLANNKNIVGLGKGILDFSKSNAEIIKNFGYGPESSAASIIVELRDKVRQIRGVPGDAVLTRVEIAKFAMGAAGQPYEAAGIKSVADLRINIAQEKALDTLMGGEGTMSSQSADAFRIYQQEATPDTQETLNQMVAENPSLLDEVAKGRSKLHQISNSVSVRDFTKTYQSILNFTDTDAAALNTELATNTYAQTTHNQIFNYIESVYSEDSALQQFAEQEGTGVQDILFAVTNSIMRDSVQRHSTTGSPYRLLSSQLKGIESALGQTFRGSVFSKTRVTEAMGQVETLASRYMSQLLKTQKTSALVNTTDSSFLQKGTSQGNLIISAFSPNLGLISKVRGKLPDTVNRGVYPLQPVEQVRIEKHVESLLGGNKVDLKGRLRLLTHSNAVYKLGYINQAEGISPLRDEFNQFIYFDTSLIDITDTTVKPTEEASVIIDILKRSNEGL